MSDVDLLGSATAVLLWEIREANIREFLPQRHNGRLKVYPATPSLIKILFGCDPESKPQPELDYLGLL
jgi:hypothetical protein